MIPQWLKSLFARHPPLCQSCAKRDNQVSFKAVPGDEYGYATRPARAQFCSDAIAGFPYRRECKQHQYTWIKGDVEQGHEQ